MALSAFANKISDTFGELGSRKRLPLGDGEPTPLRAPHVKCLPWFGSPVADENDHGHGHGSSDDQNSVMSSVPNGEPDLVKHHEAPVIQLFYDLFFVANLCTFTSVHEVNDSTSLVSLLL